MHAIINSLPDPNYATLRALTLVGRQFLCRCHVLTKKHLNRVQDHSAVNRMNAGNLAIIFGYATLPKRRIPEESLTFSVGRRLWGPDRMWRMLVGKCGSLTQFCRIPIRFSMTIDRDIVAVLQDWIICQFIPALLTIIDRRYLWNRFL